MASGLAHLAVMSHGSRAVWARCGLTAGRTAGILHRPAIPGLFRSLFARKGRIEEVIIILRSIHERTTCVPAPTSWRLLAMNNLAGQRCAWALTIDIPGQLSNFGGEQAAWGPLELTNYGFDLDITTSPTSSPTPGSDLAHRGLAVSIVAVTYGLNRYGPAAAIQMTDGLPAIGAVPGLPQRRWPDLADHLVIASGGVGFKG